MAILKPSFIESMFYNFFHLDMDRPMYFNLVFRLARSIFLQLDMPDKADELQKMIEENIEKPLGADIYSILQAYYNPRFYFSKKAYVKIGEGVDTVHVTRYEITFALEIIKNWCYDEITQLTPYIRFNQQTLPL